MTTEELVARLASDVVPVQPQAVRSVVCPALMIGAVASGILAGIIASDRALLPSTDLCLETLARSGPAFALSGVGLAIFCGSLRPGLMSPLLGRSLIAALVALVGATLWQLMGRPMYRWSAVLAGTAPAQSPLTVMILAAPVFIATAAAIRREAPTNLSLTGAALGLLSGSVGAAAFALLCCQTDFSMLVAWSAVGVLFATLAGALVGPRLLRW